MINVTLAINPRYSGFHPIMVAYFKGTTVAKTVDLYHLLLKLELA